MKRALLIAVMIMAGILLYGEDIVVKNAFYGKINPQKATHDYEIIEHKEFDKEIVNIVLSRPTLTSAGDLAVAEYKHNKTYKKIAFDKDHNEIMTLDNTVGVSEFGDIISVYTESDIKEYHRLNGKYKLIRTIDRSKFEYPHYLSEHGIVCIEDNHADNDEYGYYVSFYDPASKRMATVDYFGLLGKTFTEGYRCDRDVVCADPQRIVYLYNPSGKAGPLGTGNCGLAIFNFNGELLKLIDLPIVQSSFPPTASPDGRKFAISGYKNWDDKREYNRTDFLVYEDGSYVESIYAPGSSFLDAKWSADCSMLVGGQQIYDVNAKKYYKSFNDTGAVTNSDRGWFAQTKAGQIIVSEIKTRKPVIIVDVHPETLRWGGRIQISGDGTELICYSRKEFLRIKIKEKKK